MRWERIEPIAGLVEEIDGKVDARVDDFEGVTDPEFTGWHRLEYHLWEKGLTKGTKAFADGLDKDHRHPRPAAPGARVPAGGGRPRPGRADRGGLRGQDHRRGGPLLAHRPVGLRRQRRRLQKLFELLTPALQAKDAALTAEIAAGFAAVDKSLAEYENADGTFDPYTALQAEDKTRMQAELASLSENLAKIPGVLGLKG